MNGCHVVNVAVYLIGYEVANLLLPVEITAG